jgi:chemotaxis protein MotB
MAKNKEEKKGAPMWMVTYGDLMSLLLCFFVLLLSFSTMDPAMFKEISGSLKVAFGVQREKVLYEIPKGLDVVSRDFAPRFNVDVVLERIKSAIKLEFIKGKIDIEALDDRVILRLKDEMTFDPGSDQLKEEAKPILATLRQVIEEVPGEVMVTGHTDDTPIANALYTSNWALSAARAVSVVNFLLSDSTIADRRLAAVGYGASRPMAPNDTPEHRAMNRRVELVFMQPTHPEDLTVNAITEKGVPEQEPLPPPVY